MPRILITGIGGTMAVEICRSVRRDPSVRIIGADVGTWGREIGRRLCDDVVSLPRIDAGKEQFIAALAGVIRDQGVDFLFVNPDAELETITELGWVPACGHAMPRPEAMSIFLDKTASVEAAGQFGDFPRTRNVSQPEDIDAAFAALGSPLWMRCRVGPGGKGSIIVEDAEEARAWLRYWGRRGWPNSWMLQDFLPGRNLSWNALYRDGELVAVAAMERKSYVLGGQIISGVSGQTGHGVTIDPDECREIADRVIRAIDPSPHGFYGVDLREDGDARPRVTEVNARLAGRPLLYTESGVNLALAALRCHRGEPIGDAVRAEGGEIGLHIFRQIDIEPLIGHPERGTRFFSARPE